MQLLTVKEAAQRLRIGNTKVFDLIGRGELRSMKLDGKRLVPESAIAELIARKLAEAQAAQAA